MCIKPVIDAVFHKLSAHSGRWKNAYDAGLELPRFGCCCRIGREGSVVGKTAVCSLSTSSVWTDSEFGFFLYRLLVIKIKETAGGEDRSLIFLEESRRTSRSQ